MHTIRKTNLIEFKNSSYLFDIVESDDTGFLFVEITQIFRKGNKEAAKASIKINPTMLPKIIEILEDYNLEIQPKNNKSDTKLAVIKNYVSVDNLKEIVNRYLKGISAKDLSLQFNLKTEEIEQILRNQNVYVVSKDEIKYKSKFWRRKK